MTTSTIEYSILGEQGPQRETVVLVHGIGHRRQAWASVPERLAEAGYCVVTLDLPGHGTSPKPTKPHSYAMSSTVDQLEEFFAALELDHPHVVGNSLGGQMALELAARGSVASATAVSPAGFYNPLDLAVVGPSLFVMKAASHAPTTFIRRFAAQEKLRKISMRALYAHPERLTAEAAYEDTLNLRDSVGFWPHFVRATFLHYRGEPVVPTTVAWGDSDRLLLPRQARRAANRLPGATHVALPDCGHCPMIDDPELLVRIVEGTIARGVAERTGARETVDPDVAREGRVSVDEAGRHPIVA